MKSFFALGASLLFCQSVSAAMYDGIVMGAAGVGVTDLKTSRIFYKKLLGWNELSTFKAPLWTESILVPPIDAPSKGGPPPSASLVLMQWDKPKNVTNTGNKLVFYVDDPVAVLAKLGTGEGKIGGGIAVPYAEDSTIGNLKVAFGYDPDGTFLEIQKAENLLNVAALAQGGVSDDPDFGS
jgi:hypothetical protein